MWAWVLRSVSVCPSLPLLLLLGSFLNAMHHTSTSERVYPKLCL